MLSYLFLSILPSAWIVAAINDLKSFKIPNWISVVLIAAFPLAALYFQYPPMLVLQCIGLGVAMLVLGFALFVLNVFGGGDAKLLAATAPWIGPSVFIVFLYKVVLMGGLFALILLLFRKTPALPVYAHSNVIMNLHQSGQQIPYGVAIAAGGLWALPGTHIFTLIFGG
ncbi:MAG: A24 family peptidase [bacterium]